MAKENSKEIKLVNIVKNHVSQNIREYIIVSLMFVVGIFLGVMFINSNKDNQKEEISTYINNYINNIKINENTNNTMLLKNSIKDNILLAIGIWFAGTTIIGLPIVFGVVLFRGFCLGYTISACIYTMGYGKGMAFILITLLPQNILFIPALLALCTSGIKLYKSIVKDRRKENIKLEIVRYTAFSTLMLGLLIISAIIKINVSGKLLENIIKYF